MSGAALRVEAVTSGYRSSLVLRGTSLAVEAGQAVALLGKNLTDEAADVIFHLLVVLKVAGIPFSDVLAELERRTTRSGIAEKAARNG